MTVLVQYKFDEASSGTTPTTVADSATGTALNLTIHYNALGVWTSNGAGKGLKLGICDATGLTAGNKLIDGLHGKALASFEVVWNPGTLSPLGFGIPWSVNTAGGNALCIIVGSDGSIEFRNQNGTGAATWSAGTVTMSTVHVFHVIFDQTNGTSTDRLRLYIDGVRKTPGSYTAPSTTLNLTGTLSYTVNGSDDTDDDGRVCYWHTIWGDEALDDSTVSSRSTALLADNDTAPSGGAPAYTPPITPVTSAVMSRF